MQNMPRHQENLTVLAQFEDRERERAEPMTEGRLCSLECAPNFQPQKCSLALRLQYLCGVGHSLCSSRQVASEAHDFSPVIARPHPWECSWHGASPPPSPVNQFRPILFSFLREEDSRRYLPKSFLSPKPFDYVTHS